MYYQPPQPQNLNLIPISRFSAGFSPNVSVYHRSYPPRATHPNTQNPTRMTGPQPTANPDSSIGGDRSLSYWANASADVCGMLGGVPAVAGFSGINRVDLQGSRNFLARLGIGLKNGRRGVGSVLEGGAG